MEPSVGGRNAADSCGVIFSTCWTGSLTPATPSLTTSGSISRTGKTKPTATGHVSPSEWNWGAMEGFYTELQNRMEKDDKWDGGDWEYVPNPAGGFLSFYFAENTLNRKPYEVTMYLQIELGDDENRLTVRLCERRGAGGSGTAHV